MIRVAVLGYGFSARTFHIPFIEALPHFCLVAVQSSRPQAVREAHPGVAVFGRLAELLQTAAPDLVVISAPNHLHFELACQCLQAGVHVVLEKPMVASLDQARSLRDLANARDNWVSVYHNRRWDGDFLTLRRLIDSGRLGDLRLLESRFDRFRPEVRQRWKESAAAGAGVWYDLGSHLLDQALCLLGPPRALSARLLGQRPGAQSCDYFHVQLHYPTTEVILHSGPFAAGPNLRFQMQGSGGRYVKFGLDVQEQQLCAGAGPLDENYGVESATMAGKLYTGDESAGQTLLTERGCYQDYYRALARAIEGNSPPPVTVDDGLRVMELLALAERSSSEGRTLPVAESLAV